MEEFTKLLHEQIQIKRISGLSREMGVSRMAIYKWLDGGTPNLQNYQKLIQINESSLSRKL